MSASGLEENTIKILKATAPVVAEMGGAITTRMYQILFSEHPEQKSVFNMSHHRPGKDGKTSPQVGIIKIYTTSIFCHAISLKANTPVLQ